VLLALCSIYQGEKMKKLSVFLLVVSLFGCATGGPGNLSPEMKAAYDKPLVCKGKEQCKLYWERALFYVNKHSTYKIQTSNDSIIQTFSPTGSSPRVGYNISREPIGTDEYRLWVKVWCDNIVGCVPDVYEEIANVKIYVTGARNGN
jgi:hypothetical protein